MVVCLLLGAVVLVVGLVQLAPGATTTDHRLALLVAGTILLLLGKPSFLSPFQLHERIFEILPKLFVSSVGRTNKLRDIFRYFMYDINKIQSCV